MTQNTLIITNNTQYIFNLQQTPWLSYGVPIVSILDETVCFLWLHCIAKPALCCTLAECIQTRLAALSRDSQIPLVLTRGLTTRTPPDGSSAGTLCCDRSVRQKSCWSWYFNKKVLKLINWILDFTHWGMDKMATILQMTFSNTFSHLKMFVLIEISSKFVPGSSCY